VALRENARAMTYEDLVAIARRFEGQTLETVTGKRFKVGISPHELFFTPESSGYGQSDGRRAHERFVDRYNETGSLRPSDYAEVSRNATYLIGLLTTAGEARTTAPHA
jgi:hypothetical protein